MFLSDLCRALTRPYSVYFVEASSYKTGRSGWGIVVVVAARGRSSYFLGSLCLSGSSVVSSLFLDGFPYCFIVSLDQESKFI